VCLVTAKNRCQIHVYGCDTEMHLRISRYRPNFFFGAENGCFLFSCILFFGRKRQARFQCYFIFGPKLEFLAINGTPKMTKVNKLLLPFYSFYNS